MTTEIKDSLNEIYELTKNHRETDYITGTFNQLSYEHNTSFFLDLKEFLIKQYAKQGTIRIQKETLAFISNAGFKKEFRIKSNENDDTFDTDNLFIVIDSKDYRVTYSPKEWTDLFYTDKDDIPTTLYKAVSKNEDILRLNAHQVDEILDSELFLYMQKFNRMTEMDKRYPQKQSLLKKIINKI